ncbi:MAG: hypothetical protein JWO31_2391 [Phycisphaerales bacterium]|nr:hypothetical protein [Phycisphaerales bacterium]
MLTKWQRRLILWPWVVPAVLLWLTNFCLAFPSNRRAAGALLCAMPFAMAFFAVGVYRLRAAEERARERFAYGRCRTCGYDLRGTPDRCPECGARPDRTTVAPVPAVPRPARAARNPWHRLTWRQQHVVVAGAVVAVLFAACFRVGLPQYLGTDQRSVEEVQFQAFDGRLGAALAADPRFAQVQFVDSDAVRGHYAGIAGPVDSYADLTALKAVVAGSGPPAWLDLQWNVRVLDGPAGPAASWPKTTTAPSPPTSANGGGPRPVE